MTQFGFFIDLSRCIGCNACTIACKQWHHIETGPIKWMRVNQWENGAYPNQEVHTLPIMCLHCRKPVCVKACPHHALHKEPKYGAVLVDSQKCRGDRRCWQACPHGAPQFASDNKTEKMSKCNMCIDRLNQGLAPICVLSCSMRALEFGPLIELQKKYGSGNRKLSGPQFIRSNKNSILFFEKIQNSSTHPSVIFKAEALKMSIVPWDARKALSLWQKRHSENAEPLPDVFQQSNDVTQVDDGTYLRNKLNLKPRNITEHMTYTTDDE